MNCRDLQELLATAGRADLSPGQEEHLLACTDCREMAGAEAGLDRLLMESLAPAPTAPSPRAAVLAAIRCQRPAEDLRAWRGAELPAAAAAELGSHIESCPRCRSIMLTEGWLDVALADALPPLPDDPAGAERIKRAVAWASATERIIPFPVLWLARIAAALLIGAVGLALFQSKLQSKSRIAGGQRTKPIREEPHPERPVLGDPGRPTTKGEPPALAKSRPDDQELVALAQELKVSAKDLDVVRELELLEAMEVAGELPVAEDFELLSAIQIEELESE